MVYYVVNMVLQQKPLFNYGYCGKTMVCFVVTIVLLQKTWFIM